MFCFLNNIDIDAITGHLMMKHGDVDAPPETMGKHWIADRLREEVSYMLDNDTGSDYELGELLLNGVVSPDVIVKDLRVTSIASREITGFGRSMYFPVILVEFF